ncbi:MAG: TraR/DksA family transcriptional regulator [Proteobacteria bacterium]|nr:TraR/DksA family transcriptional regulator [Pseudomonadota bacterium]
MTHEPAPTPARPAEERLRMELVRLRTRLAGHLREADDERARLLADQVRDAEDESVADLLVDLDLAEIDRELEELRSLEAALARLRAGRYGVCVECHEAIPAERLAAQPDAARCVRCQRQHERTHAHRPTPSL